MLKGHVFSKQLFGNPIFALFINTFLNGRNGVSSNYKNNMIVTYSGSTLTIDSGAICIQGRFLEEDTSTQVASGTDTAYCKLVIEIDLDKQNTESDFQQAIYKVVKSASGYPNLTQTDIVKNNAGIYQYELARFRTNASGITDFQDMRTFLDFETIYDEIEKHIKDIDDGSLWVQKTDIAVLIGQLSSGSANIDYPSGFNKDNCVVLSVSFDNTNLSSRQWSYGSAFNFDSSLTANVPYDLAMTDTQIILTTKMIVLNDGTYPVVSDSEADYNYKLVLMKI